MYVIQLVLFLTVFNFQNAQDILDDDNDDCIPDEPNKELGPYPNQISGVKKRNNYFSINKECGAHFFEKYYCEPTEGQKKCVKNKFFGYKQFVTYEVAKQKCALDGRRLVSVLNAETWKNLKKYLKKFGAFHYWTSAYRNQTNGELYWGNDCQIRFGDWAPGEPNNQNGRPEDCVEIRPNLKWNDDPCGRKKFYICEENGCDRSMIFA